jgi:predicted esterase
LLRFGAVPSKLISRAMNVRRGFTPGRVCYAALAWCAASIATPVAGCDARGPAGAASAGSNPALPPDSNAASNAAPPEPPAPPPPAVVETVSVPDDLPAFVLRGGRGDARMVFLHGMCGHGLGYVQAFQDAAAEHGTVIGLQGDLSCGGPWRQWSGDVEGLHRRIDAAFRAAGFEGAGDDVVIMGYSQGATRAEALAARHPERYTRVVLMGAPTTPSAARLKQVRGAVMMAGERDRQDHMKAAARALSAAGVAVTYIPLPGATHGSLGATPGDGERVMKKAFDWLWADSAATQRGGDVAPHRAR